MDLSHLRALLAVIQTGTLSKAADTLGLTQPAVSRQIRLLEQEVGEKLFFRHGRGMTPTDTARRIAFRAAAGLRELDAISREVSEHRESPGGLVLLGLTPTMAEMAIVPIMGIIRQRYPAIRLRFSTAFSGYLLDWLHRGEVDMCVLYDPTRHHSVSVQPLMREELVLVAGAHRKISFTRSVDFRSIAKEPLLLPSPRHGIRTTVERRAEALGIELDVVAEADSFQVLRDLVVAGHGATILPLNSVLGDIAAGRVSAASISPVLTRQLVLARASDGQLSTAARVVGTVLAQFVADQINSGKLSAELLLNIQTFRSRL